jgi:alanine dehydrogenase
MRIGVPRETKVHEYRVGLTPDSVAELVRVWNEVCVETGAGTGIGASDDDYRRAGARIGRDAAEVFEWSELVVKVKEPLAPERALLRPGQMLFTYLHLAPDAEQLRDLVKSGVIAFAYETVTSLHGGLPLLAPMSLIAGRMAVQVAAHYLEKPSGGRGVLMGGATGAAPANVLVLGAGTVGSNALRVALGMGAQVTVLNRSDAALARMRGELGRHFKTGTATRHRIEAELQSADVVIGAALAVGDRAPRLVSREMLSAMKPASVLVDVSIDQGGCFESSHPTTHADPVFIEQSVLHYCVTNMPGAVPRTSTYALNHATLPYIKLLASLGAAEAVERNVGLRNGLNVCRGKVTCRPVADALRVPFVEPLEAIAAAASVKS